VPKRSINKSQPKDFEPKKKNPISLGNDSNIDNDFKPFRIGGIDTGLEFKNGEIKSSANNFITLQETTEILNVTKIKGNRSGSQEVPNFIFQNPDPTSPDTGLWVNVATGGLSILRSYGSAAHMVQQSESSFFFVGGADDGDLIKWQRGTSWLTPDSTAMQLDLYNTSLSIFDRSDEGDYFKIDVTTHGATTISTVDDDATAAHLTLDVDGDILLETERDFAVDSERDIILDASRNTATTSDFLLVATKKLFFDGGFNTYIEEQSADLLNFKVGNVDLFALKEDATTSAAQSSIVFTGCPIQLKDIGGVADTPGSGFGSLYVNSDELFYKNDSGTVNRLDTASKFFLNVGCYYATSIKKWLPLAQGEYDQTTYPIDYATDNANFVVPYDMKINTIYVNHNRQNSGQSQPGNTDIQLYKGGSVYSANVTVDINGSGYDATNTAIVYTFDFSGETNTFAAGQVMAISLDPTSTSYYFAITICGEYV